MNIEKHLHVIRLMLDRIEQTHRNNLERERTTLIRAELDAIEQKLMPPSGDPVLKPEWIEAAFTDEIKPLKL